ncbi:hypothetical protein [Streptomyces sp. NPDC048606]|uniref:hypothetical protein n=1 Tax=Streptomyces sp. NPDC048606 TaxID=3154726 RepID=UPI003412FDF8
MTAGHKQLPGGYVAHLYNSLRTLKLRDGGTAKINWILGTPRADLFDRDDKPQGALERPGATKTLRSGLKVTLQHGGRLKQETKITLRDGNTALLDKGLDKTWGATLRSNSHSAFLDGVHATKRPTVTLPSGLKITIDRTGTLTQHYKGKATTTPTNTAAPAARNVACPTSATAPTSRRRGGSNRRNGRLRTPRNGSAPGLRQRAGSWWR